MATQKTGDDTQMSLEKIKRRLATASTSCLMEGALLKRSETLRKWNQRWFTLDPTTGKMEYRMQKGDPSPRGLITFEPDSTITLSPINFHGARKYDGCCFYVGTPQKKEYYLCAETPTIARAWISTLRAAALVLRAHKEAVDSLSGNGQAKLGTVAAVVAAANATAREGMKEMQQSMKAALIPVLSQASNNVDANPDDVSTVMKETLRVKDEELNQVARDLRARDYMIKEMAVRLSETAEAAEAAASAARAMEKERKQAQGELEAMKKEFSDRLYQCACEVRAGDERLAAALKAREIALQEAQRWRMELGKGREQIVMMEGAVVRAEDAARRAAADADEKLKAAFSNEATALAAKEQALDQARQWQAQAEHYRAQASSYMPENIKPPVEAAVAAQGTEILLKQDRIYFVNRGAAHQESATEDSAERSFSEVPTSQKVNQISDTTVGPGAPASPVVDPGSVINSHEGNGPISPFASEIQAPVPLPEAHAVASPEIVRPPASLHTQAHISPESRVISSPDVPKDEATTSPEVHNGESAVNEVEGGSNVPAFSANAAMRDSSTVQDRSFNYITAVDFEQLQADMFQVQRAAQPQHSNTHDPESGDAPHHAPGESLVDAAPLEESGADYNQPPSYSTTSLAPFVQESNAFPNGSPVDSLPHTSGELPKPDSGDT